MAQPKPRRQAGPGVRPAAQSGQNPAKSKAGSKQGAASRPHTGGQTKGSAGKATASRQPGYAKAGTASGKGKKANWQPPPPKRYTKHGRPKYGFWNYPRKQYRGLRRWVPSWRFVLSASLFGLAALIGGVTLAYSMLELPGAQDMAYAQTTTVYYADGKTVMGQFAAQNRRIIDVSELPAHVRDAVVAAEDRTFWDNVGVDPLAMVRAFYRTVVGGARQGGSTITQQYIERYLVGQTTTDIPGKLKEAMLAVKATRSNDKMEILGAYMNTIYFGRGAYGIQTAAQAYFGIDAQGLSISQAAMLAGLIPAPSAWDPEQNLDRATQRWNYVLDGMVTMGTLTANDRAAQQFPEFLPYTVPDLYAGPQGYLLQMVRQELTHKGGLPETTIDAGGLTVITTIEKPWQDAMVAAAGDLPEDTPEGLHIGIASVDPASGAIKMLYGGPDYMERQQNAATQDITQAGSTFKPITLLAALEQGISLDQTFSGASPVEIGGWTVRNSGNAQYGQITLVQATQSSVNTVFAQLNEQVGGETTRLAAISAGLPEDTAGLDSDLTNVLGTASPHVLDMARVYATFAAQGVRHETFIVDRATAPDGSTVYSGVNDGVEAFDPDAVAELDHALQAVVNYGTGRAVGALDRPVAGKTGTSENNQSAWFCGYTPQLATAVAYYQNGPDGEVVPLEPFGENDVIQGGGPPAQLWLKVMQVAMEGQPVIDFPGRPSSRATATPAPSPTEEATEEPTDQPTPTPTTPATTAPPAPKPTPTTPAPTTPVPTTPPPTTAPPEPTEPPTGTPDPGGPP